MPRAGSEALVCNIIFVFVAFNPKFEGTACATTCQDNDIVNSANSKVPL